VRRSRIHGTGVFALRPIRKGRRVIEYTGERVSHKEADSRYADKDEEDNHTFLFIVDARTVIDAGVDGNDARFINHSCAPNCETAIENRRVFIYALRNIEPGEELAYDYQIQREDGDPPNIEEIFGCRCGAAKCRGTMLAPPELPRRDRKTEDKKPARQSARKSERKGRAKRGSGGRGGESHAHGRSAKRRRG
jgi:SET domain-containing protein